VVALVVVVVVVVGGGGGTGAVEGTVVALLATVPDGFVGTGCRASVIATSTSSNTPHPEAATQGGKTQGRGNRGETIDEARADYY
jgi:hypothetical protein